MFHQISFASKKNVSDWLDKIVGAKPKRNTSLGKSLSDFDLICQLRHASVHTGGELHHTKFSRLGLNPASCYEVDFGFADFSVLAESCQSFVRDLNLFVFRSVVDAWIKERVFHGHWNRDKYLFERLYRTCYSKTDSVGPARAYNAYQSLSTVLRSAGIP